MLQRIVTCGFVLPFLTATLYAQTGVGQIQGTVSDASRAVIPKASVVLEQVQTNNKFQTSSSDVGFFVFPSLKTGDYRLTVTIAGMEKWEGQVNLQVGQQAVVNPVLKVSGAVEQVTVAGD